METTKYVHGYSEREAQRLIDQATTLDDIIHNDSIFLKDELVLEAGCGVGAQTKIIATKTLIQISFQLTYQKIQLRKPGK